MTTKFNRAFSADEVQSIRDLLPAGRHDEPAEAFLRMWDIILLDAEGFTVDQARLDGTEVDVTAYAVPEQQLDELKEMLMAGRSARTASRVLYSFMLNGPARL